MKKYINLLLIILLPCFAYSQDIAGKTWVIEKHIFSNNTNDNVVIAFDIDSTIHITDLSNISFTFHNNDTYSAISAHGQEIDGTYSLSGNQIIMDDETSEFMMINSSSFQLSKNTNMLDLDTTIVPVISTTIFIEEGSNLPVTLIEFFATPDNNQVMLKWRTESEINNDYFEIYHSKNGTNFNKLGKVENKKSNENASTYKFIHKNPIKGINYYKLKQIDIDGKHDYSNTVTIDFQTTGEVQIYPNPTNDNFKIIGLDNINKVEIFDMKGKQFEFNYDKSNNISHLNKGIYLLKISSLGKIYTKKLIKI